ncbi:MAG: elongation factor Ts [Euryhalocaulis sp.]|uniref:translation elongation factor Ts n=1 Tax=Euryhalocaulis sp. TaxID=2744307 RepID=UPI001851A4CC|nr:translation elongation factor Ts [Euryhalocaulis sp.]MBA4800412.1 elongation factor Ts [Euryhalocaulis sp.]
MANITASQVKELRESTGAGMMDCKTALNETGGDMEAAVDWLRKKGLSKAAKKADRAATDGLIGLAFDAKDGGMTGAMVEVNSETDFVARNEEFQAGVRAIAAAATDANDVDALKGATLDSGEDVETRLTNMIAKIGENMTLRRMARIDVAPGVVTGYVHNAAAENLGKIGVLVGLKSEGDADKLNELGRKIAMHVAAAAPLAKDVDSLDPEVIERERTLLADQARDSGKPESIIDKMVEGRMRKFYEESVLLNQPFVMDPDVTVSQLIENTGKELGASIELVDFIRLGLGEGVEKNEDDFAGEVAAMAGKG